MHPVLLLHDELPQLLVEWRPLSGTGDAAAGLSLDRRQPRREDRRAPRRARRSVPALSLPHHHELHEDLPQGPQPGQGHRRDQEAHDRAALSGRQKPESQKQVRNHRVLVITGGSRGIGAATAVLAASRGYGVCFSYRERADRAQEVVAAIERAGGRAVAVKADIRSEAEVSELFDAAEAFGRMTGLVNNAG